MPAAVFITFRRHAPGIASDIRFILCGESDMLFRLFNRKYLIVYQGKCN